MKRLFLAVSLVIAASSALAYVAVTCSALTPLSKVAAALGASPITTATH